jgi:hypothetical protein
VLWYIYLSIFYFYLFLYSMEIQFNSLLNFIVNFLVYI